MKIKLVILLACLCGTLWSQEVPIRQFSVHDGLMGQQIICLYEDSRGYLWVGTRLGLSKFNGETFETFGVKDGLPHQYICGITEDEDGTICVLTRKGISFYDGANWESIETCGQEIIGAVSLLSASRDSSYILNHNKLYLLSDGSITEYPIRSPESDVQLVQKNIFSGLNRIYAIFQKGDNLLLYSVINGEEISLEVPGLDESVLAVQAYSKSGREYFYINHENDYDIYEFAPDGFLQTATIRDGVFIQNKISSDTIYLLKNQSVYEARPSDQQLRLAFNHTSSGLNRLAVSIKEYFFLLLNEYLVQYQLGPFTNYPQFSSIWAITPDRQDNIWVGSYTDKTVHCIKPDGEIDSVPSDLIVAGLRELLPIDTRDHIFFYNGPSCNNKGDLFFPLSQGVMKLSNGKASSLFGSESKSVIFSYFDEGRDQMVFGVYSGINIVKSENSIELINSKHGLHTNAYIVSIAEDRKSRYWLGSFNGLSLYDPDQQKVLKNFYSSDPHSNVKGGVVCMTRDHLDNLWFGTAGGLALLDEQADTLIPVGRREMPIYCSAMVAMDSTFLLITTSDGLYRFNAKEYLNSGRIQYTLYNDTNGFIGMDPHQNAMVKDRNGNIWIGCVNMVVKLEPEKFDDKRSTLRTIIRQINETPITFQQQDSETSLEFSENNIRILFEAVGTARHNTTLYSYQLEGYDSDWSTYQPYANATYNRVPNGNYRFCVRAQGNSVGEQENPCACVPIYVHASFFQNAHFHYYAIAIIFIISLILILLIYFYQLSIRKRQEKEQESTLLRINTLQAQMNPHFVFNVFSSLQHLILTHNIDVANEYLGDFSKMVRQFLNASVLAGRQGTTTSKESDILLADELELITSYIRFEQLNYQDRFDFFLKVDDVALKEISIPPMIIQPFVENAIKHGLLYLENEKGLLTLLIKKHPNQSISIILIDNGVGRAESMRLQEKSIRTHRSHGTKLVMDRVKVLNKLGYHITISIENNQPRGTIVTVNFMPD